VGREGSAAYRGAYAVSAAVPKVRLSWAEDAPPVVVASADELFAQIERLGSPSDSESRAVKITAHDQELIVGLGSSGSFIQVSAASGDPPYHVVVGESLDEDGVDFYLHGQHHTQIPRRLIIPWAAAQRVIREWIATGKRSRAVSWDAV